MEGLKSDKGMEKFCKFVDFTRGYFGEENIKTIQEKHLDDKGLLKYVVDFYIGHCPPKINFSLRYFEGINVVYKIEGNPVTRNIFTN